MRWRKGAACQAVDCRSTNFMRTVAFVLNTVAALSSRQACSLLHVSPLWADLRWSKTTGGLEIRFLFISLYSFCTRLLHSNNLVASPPASQSEAAPLQTVLLTLRQDHVRTTAWGPSDVCLSATCPVWKVESKRRKGGVSIEVNRNESTVMLRASWKVKKMSRNSGDTKQFFDTTSDAGSCLDISCTSAFIRSECPPPLGKSKVLY